MSFLLSFFSFFTILTARIDWFNDYLEVPLYSDIDNYKYLPEAKLYINGIKINDPLMYYDRDAVDHTFFSVISTNYVKTYTIRYRAVFPSYQISDTQDIVFDIVDQIPPSILMYKTFRVPLGQKVTDFTDGLVLSDNYDQVDKLMITVDSLNVIWDQVGTYQIFYQVSDASGNYTNQMTEVVIYDYLAPEIIQKEPLVISFDIAFNWEDFIEVSDNDDPFPNVFVDDSKVDYLHLGQYELSLTATDRNGLSKTAIYQLSIIDDKPPIINTRSNPLPIPVFSDPLGINFNDYILNVTDNYDLINKDNVTMIDDIEYDVVGTYEITFYVEDSSGNSSSKKMSIDVVDNQKPSIIIQSTLEFNVFDSEPIYMELIDYQDNYTDHDLLTTKITESVNMNKIGRYLLTIEVKDQSGNQTVLNTYVNVIDFVAPEIIKVNDILIVDFTQKSYEHYFEATDNYDVPENLTFIIDDHEVIYDQIGSYPLYVYASDLSDNTSTLVAEVNIIDLLEPILNLKQTITSIEVYSPPLDLTSFILEVSDNYDDLSMSDVTITCEIDYEVLGIYLVTYELIDSSMNKTEKYLYVTVDDFTPPSAVFMPLTIQTNEYFDPLSGISIEDNQSGYTIHTFPDQLDTSIPGTKEVTYVITDSRGNYTTKIRKIIVEQNNEQIPPMKYLPVILITILGGTICYYIYRKML